MYVNQFLHFSTNPILLLVLDLKNAAVYNMQQQDGLKLDLGFVVVDLE